MTTRVIRPERTEVGALSVEGVTRLYGDEVAIEDITLEVQPGEFLTLLGPSGAGKTTLLRVIAGFIHPHAGSVNLDGRDLTGMPPHKRNLGMVFQNYALFPHMTAAENVAFPLEARRLPRHEIHRMVDEALRLVRLEQLGDRYPRQLSGGQQQRIALARALVFHPPVLLMDEPLGALDKQLREALQLEIMQISRDLGVTIIYVTHDQEEALAMSDRIAVFNKGRIQQTGTGEELYEQPSSLFVASFIGESNIFRGTLDVEESLLVRSERRPIRLDPKSVHRLGLASGDAIALVVRPERTYVRPASGQGGTGDRREMALRGTLEEAIYLGPVIKFVVRTEEGIRLFVRTPQASARATFISRQVEVHWQIDEALLVPV
ncbi:MAG TPA: ABC transporter ATP-binding protein [Actinomycetota bacterium]|nr:ABC transporter ATP-binding protein [Actinomycetota bacterium]